MNRLSLWIILPLLRLISTLASDTASRLGGTLGVLAFHLRVRRQHAGMACSQATGLRGPERARVLRRAYATMGANFVDLFTAGGPAGPECGLSVANPLWTALQLRQTGVVFITPHLGTWEGGASALSRFGRIIGYAKAQHNALVDAMVNDRRRALGIDPLVTSPGDKSTAIHALRALRSGAMLGLIADQRPGQNEGSAAWFLGRGAWCHDGPAFFAARAKTCILPGFALRIRAGKTLLFLGRPIMPHSDHLVTVQTGMDALTAMIVRFPGQYFWHHRRFAGPQPEPTLPHRHPTTLRGYVA